MEECISVKNTGDHDWWYLTRLWRECVACGKEEYRKEILTLSDWIPAHRTSTNMLVDSDTNEPVTVR